MGHLNTRHYLGMFDDASYHFFAELNSNLERMKSENRGFADVKSTLEYLSELRSGALVEVRSSMLRLGNKSFSHRHEMYNRSSGELAATMENTTVAFDLQERRAVALFEDFRISAQQLLHAQEGT